MTPKSDQLSGYKNGICFFFLFFFNRLVTFDVPDIPHETNQFCHLFQDIRNAELL